MVTVSRTVLTTALVANSDQANADGDSLAMCVTTMMTAMVSRMSLISVPTPLKVAGYAVGAPIRCDGSKTALTMSVTPAGDRKRRVH